MALSTNNLTDLRDQLFLAIEGEDINTLKRLLELFPVLKDERINGMSLQKFAARHGHSKILKYLGIIKDKEFIKDLIKEASIDGHNKTISLLVNSISDLFDYKNLEDDFYKELLTIVPEKSKNAIYFPYIWEKVKGAMFLYYHNKLPSLPLKKLAKFLY